MFFMVLNYLNIHSCEGNVIIQVVNIMYVHVHSDNPWNESQVLLCFTLHPYIK